MKFSVSTLFPDMYTTFFERSLIGRAIKEGVVSCKTYDMFSVCAPKERIDGPTYGHYAGVVIRPEVVERSIESIEREQGRAFRVFLSPRGEVLNQSLARSLYHKASVYNHMLFVAARYEGIDVRAEEEYADAVVSIGDFVLMGGDVAVQILLEAVMRYVPRVVGKQESVERDSFTGPFVDAGAYTAPVAWKGRLVPEVLRSGNHKKIEEWSLEDGATQTVYGHFSWLQKYPVSSQDVERVQKIIPPHYIVLMHDDIMLPEGRIGTTSVTSLDIHDIARSAKTYGCKGYIIVTPLVDQQKIVSTLLHFWQEGDGTGYNPHRSDALQSVSLKSSYEEAIAYVTAQEGVPPVVVVTSAREVSGVPSITYFDQKRVWAEKRPVLIVLGTGKGLSQRLMEKAQYVLCPLRGFSSFNHLSVRSAAAIIMDRWLGINPHRIHNNE